MLLGLGCAPEPRPAAPLDRAPALTLAIAGEVDPGRGVFRIDVLAEATSGLEEIVVHQDGAPGVGPPETVELVTTSLGQGEAGCGVVDSFCGDVTLRSFASPWLLDVFVELTDLSPPIGHEALNSSPPALGASDRFGLWSYGPLAPAGRAGAHATRRWVFRDVSGTPFRFRGRVLAEPAPGAQNVILFVGDGMGQPQIDAARIYKTGGQTPLAFESFPFRGQMGTNDALGRVTDSAASATAMATGVKVRNGVVSVRLPGDGAALRTALEIQGNRRRRTGLVTAGTPITDATPAGFGAHQPSRTDEAEIAADYFTETRPNVLFGLLGPGITVAAARAAGYAVVIDARQMRALDRAATTHVSGQFRNPTPPLAEMTGVALDILGRADNGFFLLVEHERTDTCGHSNDLPCVVDALLELEAAVAVALTFAQGRDDTLIVVTGDHETGGLRVTETNPTAGVVPAHRYTTRTHTGQAIPIFATGPGAERVPAVLENTDLFPILAGLP